MLIGVTGNKFHGKDSIGNILIRNFHYTKGKFALGLKRSAVEVYGDEHEDLYENERTKDLYDPYWEMTNRDKVIELGQKMREARPDHWIKLLGKRLLQRAKSEGTQIGSLNIVITDCRFLNEAEYIQAHDGYIIRVIDPRKPAPTGADDKSIDPYTNKPWVVSETEQFLIRADAEIYNEGTLYDLAAKVDETMLVFNSDTLSEGI